MKIVDARHKAGHDGNLGERYERLDRLLVSSPLWGEGFPPQPCARCFSAALAQVAWREGRGGDALREQRAAVPPPHRARGASACSPQGESGLSVVLSHGR